MSADQFTIADTDAAHEHDVNYVSNVSQVRSAPEANDGNLLIFFYIDTLSLSGDITYLNDYSSSLQRRYRKRCIIKRHRQQL